jgi:NADPH:quinone reductase-like Zn-dependent oxidoreductase
MKAVLIRKYGGPEVLELAEIPSPRPLENEVLVKVHASTVNPIDWLIRDGAARSYIKNKLPTIMGCDLAGTVVEVGARVTRVKVGDEVFAMMPHDWGAMAELVPLAESLLVKKPAALSMEEAASLCTSAMTALKALRQKGRVASGDRVLVNGASSSVGMAAVQIAKALGANVTAVCGGASFDLVKGLGADRLVDYKATDFTGEPERYDVIFDCIGNQPYPKCKKVLQGKKVHATTMPSVGTLVRQLANPFFGVKVFALMTSGDGEQLEIVRSLVESGKLKPVIDRVMPVAQIAAAHEYSKSGRAKGKIVITFPVTA